MSYITAKIRADKIFHGYDEEKHIVTTDASATNFVEKLIRVDRILSVTEDYIFIECPHETVQTWEYEGSLDDFKNRLAAAGVSIS